MQPKVFAKRREGGQEGGQEGRREGRRMCDGLCTSNPELNITCRSH